MTALQNVQTVLSRRLSGEEQHARRKRWEANIIFYMVFMLIGGVPLLVTSSAAAWAYHRYGLPRWKRAGLAVLAAVWAVLVVVTALRVGVGDPLGGYGVFWLAIAGSAPIGAEVIRMWPKARRFFTGETIGEQYEREAQRLERKQQQQSQKAEAAVTGDIPQVRDHINLGWYMSGDEFPKGLDVIKTPQGFLYLTNRALNQHMLVIGRTGAGKTETLKRLVWEVAQSTDRDIFVIDGKGESAFALAVASILHQTGRGQIPIFTMGGTEQYGSVYNAFVGGKQQICNRLIELMQLNKAEGNATYYAKINKTLTQWFCGIGAEWVQPPRSLEELRDRANLGWLKNAYQQDTRTLQEINEVDPQHFADYAWGVRELHLSLSPYIDPSGFVIEQCRGAVFSLKTMSVGTFGNSFFRFFIEDMKDFVSNRVQRPSLMIVDEFQEFGQTNITSLLSMARSKELSIVLATQSTSSLGEGTIKEKILDNTATKVLMGCDRPEDIATLAGTRTIPHFTMQTKDGDVNNMGSLRMEETFAVPPNVVRQLPRGEGFIIRQGLAAHVKIAQIPRIQESEGALIQYLKPAQPAAPAMPAAEPPKKQRRSKNGSQPEDSANQF
jgi:Cdc6-like AAA superfamily ATPase